MISDNRIIMIAEIKVAAFSSGHPFWLEITSHL